jgi:hypothetical protein
MKPLSKSIAAALLAILLFAAGEARQKKPEISVAPSRVKSGGIVMLTGTGFTPDRPVMSHLRRPDDSEYNPLRLRANERGEVVHRIDTVMLEIGEFEVWIEDETSKVVSNRARFTVE